MSAFADKLDLLMRERGMKDVELAGRLRSPRTGGEGVDSAYIGRLRTGKRRPGPDIAKQLVAIFGPDDGAALRQALAEDKTPPSIRAALAAATARADASISEADKLYFPATFKAPHKDAARKLVAAIFSATDADPAWLTPAVARFEGAAFAALDATNDRLARGAAHPPPLQNRA